jgi:hypothetical protein
MFNFDQAGSDLKNAVFLDMTTPYGCCKNRRFEGIYRHHLQGEKLRVLLVRNEDIPPYPGFLQEP